MVVVNVSVFRCGFAVVVAVAVDFVFMPCNCIVHINNAFCLILNCLLFDDGLLHFSARRLSSSEGQLQSKHNANTETTLNAKLAALHTVVLLLACWLLRSLALSAAG